MNSFSRRSRGTALVETMVSTAIFSLMVIATFAVYSLGKYEWKSSVIRHSLEWNVRKSLSLFEYDARMTNYNSVNWINNSSVTDDSGVIYPRTAICFPGLDSWNNPANFSTQSLAPIWNVYIIYISTTEKGAVAETGGISSPTSGRFYRIQLTPNNNQLPVQMAGQYGDLTLVANAIWSLPVQDYKNIMDVAQTYSLAGSQPTVTYMGSVDAFMVNKLNGFVQMTYRTKQKATAMEAGTRGGAAYEGLQIDFTVQPQNTPQ